MTHVLVSWSFGCRFHRDWFDFDALDDRVAGIGNEHFPQLEPADDFQIIAIVAADLNLLKVHGVVGTDHRNLGSVGAISVIST